MKPAIVVVTYNRPSNLKRLLNALENAHYEDDDIELIISIDYGGDSKVYEVADKAAWSHGNKTIKKYSTNQGLKNHILQCGDLSEKYGAVIIFEDDTFPSPYFYSYTKQALDKYKDNEKIFAISLYAQDFNGYANRTFAPIDNGYDAFISQIECSWGECFIGERWKKFRKWYEEHEKCLEYNYEVPKVVYSWEQSRCKFLLYYIVENNLYYLTPYKAFSTNFHSKGTHIKENTPTYQVPLAWGTRKYRFPEFDEAVKYDAFFESVELKEYLEKQYKKKVCIDYFGVRDGFKGYDYALSSRVLPYKCIKSYGLEMRPVELNVYFDINGNDLYLYDCSTKIKTRKNRQHHFNLVKYEVKDLSWQDSLFYFLWYWYGRIIK
jgi:hypothetical protein